MLTAQTTLSVIQKNRMDICCPNAKFRCLINFGLVGLVVRLWNLCLVDFEFEFDIQPAGQCLQKGIVGITPVHFSTTLYILVLGGGTSHTDIFMSQGIFYMNLCLCGQEGVLCFYALCVHKCLTITLPLAQFAASPHPDPPSPSTIKGLLRAVVFDNIMHLLP